MTISNVTKIRGSFFSWVLLEGVFPVLAGTWSPPAAPIWVCGLTARGRRAAPTTSSSNYRNPFLQLRYMQPTRLYKIQRVHAKIIFPLPWDLTLPFFHLLPIPVQDSISHLQISLQPIPSSLATLRYSTYEHHLKHFSTIWNEHFHLEAAFFLLCLYTTWDLQVAFLKRGKTELRWIAHTKTYWKTLIAENSRDTIKKKN